MEASNELKQAQHFSTCRKVQNGNSRVHQDLPDSRGVGIVDRPIAHFPSHPILPNSGKYLRFCHRSQVFQFTSLPFGLTTAPPGLYDCKGSEANGPLQRTQASPIPGQLADQVPVSGGSPSEHSGSGRPNPVLGVDHKSGKIRTETYSGVFRLWATNTILILPL